MEKDKLKITVIDHENGFIGPSCMRGFQALGHKVQLLKLKGEEGTKVLDFFDITLLLTEIIPFGPDLIVDINGKACDRDGISLTAFRILNIPVFIWFVDNPLIALNYGKYNFSDMFTKLVYDRSQCEEMRNLGISKTYHLPLGVDTDYFKPLRLTCEEERRYKADISFVGHSYADRCLILRNVLRNRWPDMPEIINDVIKYSVDLLIHGLNGSGRSTPNVLKEAWGHFGINPVYPDSDIEWIMNIIIEHDSGRDYRAELVRPLLKYGIKIYGNKSWSMMLGSYNIHPPVHYFEELPKVYNASSINLNISRTQLVTAVNQRVFDVPACRSFLLTDYKEELEDYFVIGKEIICYKDKEDLNRLVGHYLNYPAQMKKIAEAGYQRVVGDHSYTGRMNRIVDIFESMPDNKYEVDEKGEAWEKANLFIGQAYLNLSDKVNADIHFKKALNPDSMNYVFHLNSVGVSLLQQKDYNGSIPVFLKASELDNDESSFLSNLGLAYKNTGKYEEAEYYYKKALEKDPSNSLIIENLNNLYKKRKKEEDTNPITLCMIAKNEEANLAQCLKSVQSLVSEVIIIDTGSEDRTIEIAQEFGAQVYHFKWNDSFSDARNVSLDHAAKEWILILDADEIIAERDLESLRLLCKSKEYDAYSIVTRNYINDSRGAVWIPNDNSYNEGNGYTGWFPSRKVRLFRNDRRIRFSGVVHELVEDSVIELKLNIGDTPIPVHHYGAVQSESATKEKRIRYINYCKKKIEEEPDNPKAYYEYGIECCEYGLQKEAVDAFKKVLEINPKFPFVHGYLGASLISLGLHREAIVHLNQGIIKEPDNPGLYNNLASAYYEIGEYDKAIIYYKKAIAKNPDYASGYKNIGLAYLKLNDSRLAIESLEKALMLNPYLDDISMLLNELKKDNKKKPVLSLCMIVRNEESVLKECLESVSGIVDEIVIVDTGSEDNTLKIASSFGAKIIKTDWNDDFSRPRNISIQNASGDYILWLDADEHISGETRGELLKLKLSLPENKPEKKKVAYSLIITSRRDNLSDNLEDESFRRLRIFPRLPGVEFKGKVHEDMGESLNKLGVKVKPIDVEIIHKGYRNDNEVKLKIKRNIPLLLKQHKEIYEDPLISFYLANSYYGLGDTLQAIKFMEEVIKSQDMSLSDKEWFPFAFIKLAQFYRDTGEQNKAGEIYSKLLKSFPQFTSGHFFFGEMLYFQGKINEAIKEFEQLALAKIEICEYPVPVRKISFLKYYYTGCCHLELGNYQDAAYYFEKAKELDTGSVNLHISVARLLALTGEIDVCVDLCNVILKDLNINMNETINSVEELSGVFRTIGSSLEAISRHHEALQAYKTAFALSKYQVLT